MTNTVIQLKKSSTPSSVPASLANGELAINFADGILYYKAANGSIASISGSGYNYGVINANGTLLLAGSVTDKFTVLPGDFITITGDAINDTLTIGANVKSVFDVANNALPNTTGAVFNGNLNIKTDLWIGNNITNVSSLIFNTSTNRTPTIPGELTWSSDDSTLHFNMDTPGSVVGHIGQDLFYLVKNQTGSTIPKGTVVRFAGTVGASGRLLVAPAIGDNTYPSKYVIGVTAQAISDGTDGYVIAKGKIRGLDMSMFSAGDILYVSPTTAGAFSNTLPKAPNNKVTIAAVINNDNTQGTIEVRVTLGSKINEDELVELNDIAGGDTLVYISANGRFENRNTLVTAFGVANAAFGHANGVATNATAAFGYANGVATNTTAAFGHSNLTYNAVNSAFGVINAAFGVANNAATATNATAAFTYANGIATNTTAAFAYANSVATNTTAAFAAANQAGVVANSVATNTTAAFAYANGVATNTTAAFAYANSVATNTTAAFAAANQAGVVANSVATNTTAAFAYANGVATNTTAAFAYANSVAINTTAAFAAANQAGVVANSVATNTTAAFAYANGIATNTTAAFAYANGIATNTTAAFAFANGVATNTTAAFAYANGVATNTASAFAAANQAGAVANSVATNTTAAFAYANGVATNTTAAFAYANSVATNTTAAFAYANGVATNTTAAFAAANQAGVVANNANTYAGSTYVKKSGDTITGDLIVQGNVTISGNTTYANTQTLLIGDAIITLNNDIPAAVAPSENAGIEIKRGSSANVSIIWNETGDKWTFSNDGVSWVEIASNVDVGSANNYAGAMANGAGTIANSAFTYANGVATNTTAAFTYANGVATNTTAAFTYANGVATNTTAAFAYANGIATNTTAAFAAANQAGVVANSVATNTTAAFAYANGVATNTTAAFAYANGIATNTTAAFAAANQAGAVANSVATNTTAAFAYANSVATNTTAAFAYANGVAINTTASFAYANGVATNTTAAFGHSNLTYNAVNSAMGIANAAFGVANNAATATNATAAFAYANGVATNTTAAFAYANSVATNATAAFAAANQAGVVANSVATNTTASFAYANGVATNTTAAFAYANGVATNTASAFGLTNTTYAAVNSAFGVINAAFGVANNAATATNATAAFAYANGVAINTTASFAYANGVAINTTASFAKANAAYIVANAAFDKANVGAAAGVTISTTPPVSPTAGELWWNSALGRMFVWYSDVDSSQWVETSPSAGTIDYNIVANSVFPLVANTFNSSYNTTNAAFNLTNATYTAVNSAFVVINSAFGSANTSGSYANQAGVIANAAFDKANSANVLAYNTGIGANGYASAVGTSANVYAAAVGTSANAYARVFANTVGSSANAYADASFTTIANGAAAFAKANAALANTTGTFAGDLRVTGNVVANTLNTTSGFIDMGPGSRPAYAEGRIYYDNVDKSLNVNTDDSNFTLPVGQKEYVKVYNNSGTTISKGKPVYATGYHTTTHQHPTIALADASNADKYDVLGLVASDIPDASHGYVIIRGWIGGIDTSALTVAKRFHLGYATPGSLVTIAPEYPNYPYDIGYCVVSDATNGYLYIDRQSHTQEGLRVLGTARVGGDMTVEGDFTVLGTQTITSTSSLAVGTQYIYLGVGDSIPAANITFTGSGLNDMTFKGHYEGVGTTSFWVKITEANVNGDYFSWSYDNFATTVASNTKILYQTNQLLSNGISVYFQANTGHTIGDKWNASTTAASVDSGFVTNHTDPGKYTHAGLFRDATDGTFKFFNTYDAEPAGNIDIANNTFSLGNVEVLKITASQIFAGATEIGSLVPIISEKANAGFTVANAAFTYANGIATNTTAAFAFANSVATNTTASFAAANQAGVIANAAFGAANTAGGVANNRLANTSGVSFAGNLFFPSGCVAIGIASTNYPLTIASGAVTPLTGLAGALITAEGSVNGVNQLNIRNASNGAGASSDYVVTADDGTDTTNFIDLGINNSNYNAPAFWTINGIRDGYLYMPDGNLSIGVANTTSSIKFINFFLGGALAADEVMRIQDSAGGANVGIGRTNPTTKLDVVGTVNASSYTVNGSNLVSRAENACITYVIDGGGLAITTGEKGHIEVPFPCVINNVTVLLDQTGSINVAIQKDVFANFPPVAADTINSAGFVVTTATNVKVPSSRITTTTINAGDILAYNVTSIATATRATISIQVTKT